MTQKQLENILDAHRIPAHDRPPFRLLIEHGMILRPGFGPKLRRGKFKKCLDALLAELSKPVIAKHFAT